MLLFPVRLNRVTVDIVLIFSQTHSKNNMLLKILGSILVYLFGFVFKASKETAQSAANELVELFTALSKIGGSQIKEFLATIPIFLEFFIHLIKNKDQLENGRQLLLVGAATALSSMIGLLIVSVLGSWTVQLALVVAFPLLGVPLFLATGLAITTIIVLFIWLVIFVLNKALADDPAYQKIRDGYLTPKTIKILSDIEAVVKQDQITSPSAAVSNTEHLYQIIENQLFEQGAKADVSKVILKLEKIKIKLSKNKGQMERFDKVSDRIAQENNSPT